MEWEAGLRYAVPSLTSPFSLVIFGPQDLFSFHSPKKSVFLQIYRRVEQERMAQVWSRFTWERKGAGAEECGHLS